MEVLLKNLTWMQGNEYRTRDLRIHQGIIQEIGSSLTAKKKERVVDMRHHYLYPGLINSHDHLEMNLYPHLGSPPYKNYTQWASDIYRPAESPVKEIESLLITDRLLWGGIKNLVSGATTVIHHNPWHRILDRSDFPVKVLKKYRWAHSLAFDKKVVENFPSRSKVPFIIHAAEGIDSLAHGEIKRLHEMGMLKKNTVLVHGVGLSKNDIELMREANASVIWCPSSNFFMFGQTTDVPELKNIIPLALGSDSTMTGPPSLLDEMRAAVKTGHVTPKEVFDMITSVPAKIFNIPYRGIEEGGDADLLIFPISKSGYYENLLAQETQHISAVFVNGKFLFGDSALGDELSLKLHQWKFGDSVKGIAFDIAALKRNILKKTPVRHLNENSLWHRLAGD